MHRVITRKEFLKSVGLGASALVCASAGYGFLGKEDKRHKSVKGHIFKNDAPKKPWKWSVEGFHYATDGTTVQCQICPNRCILEPGDRSICRSKVNIGGKLYSLTYGNPCSIHVDPIEKKPLNHFYPRSLILSIATTGCNFRCLNCQNWEISQIKPEEVSHYELFPLIRLCKYLDGANVNLKSFDDRIYRSLNGGRLQPVLNTFKTLHTEGVWFEMTTLVVPTYVDDTEMIKRMCGWILKELGPNYPLHFLRFFPHYKLARLPATPIGTLGEFRNVALQEGIRYVYLGNVPGHEGTHTYCHNCHKILIERKGYFIPQYNLENGRCKFCGTSIPGRWG
jgi:pyruvate formate lyase activating enzyme